MNKAETFRKKARIQKPGFSQEQAVDALLIDKQFNWRDLIAENWTLAQAILKVFEREPGFVLTSPANSNIASWNNGTELKIECHSE